MEPENLLPYLNYLSLGSIVSQFNPVHNLKSQLFKINFMSYIHLRLNCSGNSFSWFLTKTCLGLLFAPKLAALPAHFTFLTCLS